MKEQVEKAARMLVEQWDKIPHAGAHALETLLLARLEDAGVGEQEAFLDRVRELARHRTGPNPDIAKSRSLKKLEDAIESLNCRS